MTAFVDYMTAHLQRNHELYEQAKAKAARLDDGTERGRLKAQLVLALDELRRYKDVVKIYRMPERADGSRSDFMLEKEALALVDLREVRDKVLDLIRQLDALGVVVKLSRRNHYLLEDPHP